ncbi:hypothetical protein SI65_00310 [Aspergillus cristatus]|uniref:Mediator of RNA polymerase II transcription subunit 19 n=1 Tax=Aspergillus cristatus TaxID=573508 RepID=A0A1E3BPK2_ASPCR|nr:hypothetical protein SI65_00310 [Aspergillus cristatus]
MSDRASSATFRVGFPSPSSPSVGYLKENDQPYISSDHFPQTPTSPPLMSVSAQSHATHFAPSQTSPRQATSQSADYSSLPSSDPMSSQVSQQPTLSSTTTSFPTPASSVSGHLVDADKSTGTGMQESGSTVMADANVAPTQTPPEHTQTDHDRNMGGADPGTGVRDSANMDAMEIDNNDNSGSSNNEGAASSENNDFSLDSLQREFTSAYHLCKSSHVVTGPDPSLDLVSLYGLGPIAKSVARMDPVTGEKINRLRKSYEGKLKGLGLAGRNKPVKNEAGMPGSLRHLTMWPEEEWQNQNVFGKQIKIADMDSALQQLQMKAMKLEPGTVPNNDYWEDVLGHEKPSKHVGAGDAGKKAAAPSGGVRAPSQSNGTPAPAELERSRPSRGHKRRYDDNSFVGYGEGYADDDDEGAFYSNSEGIGKKKRKKV